MPLIQTDELERLLWMSLFFSGKDAQNILERCKHAPPKVVDELIVIVKDGLKKQKEMLYQMTDVDPEFPGKLQTFLKGEITKSAQESEKKSQENIENIFES